jgi:hypothetical protein
MPNRLRRGSSAQPAFGVSGDGAKQAPVSVGIMPAFGGDCQGGFMCVHAGHEDGGDTVVARQSHHRQDAVGVTQRAVESKLAQKETAGIVEHHLFAGAQHAHGHRHVVAGALCSGLPIIPLNTPGADTATPGLPSLCVVWLGDGLVLPDPL